MFDWLEKLLERKTNSVNDAKEGLKLVSIHDRTDLTAEAVESLNEEHILKLVL